MRFTSLPRLITLAAVLALPASGLAVAQDERPKSPTGAASTQIGDAWIDVTYSRPILRGRQDIFGSGEDYGKTVTGRAPVWRAGANATTRIKTEVDLEIGGTRVPAGDYGFFIALAEGSWTAILSRQPSMATFDRAKIEEGLTWGAYGYDPELDVVRAPMELSPLGMSIDQMTIFFADVTEAGGKLGLAWGDQLALLPFRVAGEG